MITGLRSASVWLLACTLLHGADRKRALPAVPAARSVCELAKTPSSFDGKIVSVRGRILIGFEEFEFSIAECSAKKLRIWLEYGSGPKRQPARQSVPMCR